MNFKSTLDQLRKRIQLSLVFVFGMLCMQIQSQTDVITGIEKPYAMAVHGDVLYVTKKDSDAIIKVDLTVNPPVAVDFITGLDLLYYGGLVVHNNALYFIQKSANSNVYGCIKKVSLVTDAPSITTVFDNGGSAGISALQIFNGMLYVAEFFGGHLQRIDLTTDPKEVTDLATGVTILGSFISVNATNMYISDGNYDMYDIDLTINPPSIKYLEPQIGITSGSLFFQGDLYVVENSGNTDDSGTIKKFDPTSSAIEYTTIVNGLNKPVGLVVYKDELYFTESGANKISKISLTPLSVETHKVAPSLELFPNPVTNFFGVSNLNSTHNFVIYNVLGRQVIKGTIAPKEKIDISGLSSGVYAIQFASKKSMLFIKQ